MRSISLGSQATGGGGSGAPEVTSGVSSAENKSEELDDKTIGGGRQNLHSSGLSPRETKAVGFFFFFQS